MKDAYSFHLDQASLQRTYEGMYNAYGRIFRRCGLEFRAVKADTGAIGGAASHEFHVLADSGEDAIAFSDAGDYAANVELAEALPPTAGRPAPARELRLVDTPDCKTIQALVEGYDIPADRTVKTLVVAASDEVEGPLVALLVRGDHELNGIKAEKLSEVAVPLRMATEAEIQQAVGAGAGSLGPLNLPMPCIADRAVTTVADFTAGANIEGKHYFGLNWERDLPLPAVADLRNVQAGDPSPDGKGSLHILRGIEVGHIFQLGDKYSAAMGCSVLDESGRDRVLTMGCYGIGVSRIVAAAIEQNHDDRGIIWPAAIAPFTVALLPMNMHKSQRLRGAVEALYKELLDAGIAVLLDDRGARPGVMFADMELVGIPHRLVLGERALDDGEIEYKGRSDDESLRIPLEGCVTFIKDKLAGIV